MDLIFDLYSLSDPKVSDHVTNLVAIVVCAAVAAVTFRITKRRRSAYSRFGYMLRLWIPLFLACIVAALVVDEIGLLSNAYQAEIARFLEQKDFEIENGEITNIGKDKIWKSDPIPTFRVAETEFEFGVYSKNFRLLSNRDGGPIKEGRTVEVWHHDGLVLRVYDATNIRK